MHRILLLVIALSALFASSAQADPAVRQGAAVNPDGLRPVVDAFRADLGGVNNGVGGTFESGRREINWDGVPDVFSSPAPFPGDFFNANSPRGVVFTTPGSGFAVSRTSAQGQVRFADIDPSYSGTFQTFSPQRLFVASGSNITDVVFTVPGKQDRLGVKGFGAVFTDVDVAGFSRIQYFDASGGLLLDQPAPSGSFAFVGATFDGPADVYRVRITAGTRDLAPGITDGGGNDLVALDDFVYGEPRDADGVGLEDNCPGVPNPDQADTDGDRKGDACDPADATPSPVSTEQPPSAPQAAPASAPDPAPSVSKLGVRRAKRGFKVSYSLSETARVAFTVEKKTRTGTFKRVKGGFFKTGKAGANAFKFSGRVNRKRLGAGTYRLVALAVDPANQRSATVRKGFRVPLKRR